MSTTTYAAELEAQTARRLREIEESQNDPAAIFHVGQRVVDCDGRFGTVIHERILRGAHGYADHQRVTVLRDNGTRSEQAAVYCDFPPLTEAEIQEEQQKEAEQQALVDRNRPEEYDRWPGEAGWVGNDE